MIAASTAFDSGGSVEVAIENRQNRVSLELDDAGGYPHQGYFQFRLDGVGGEEVSFEITNLDDSRMPADYRLVYADDPTSEEWTRMSESVGGGFSETFDGDTVYVADVRAYPYEQTVDRVHDLETAHPEYVETELIGESHQGRPMYAMRITDPDVDDARKRDVVNVARQHPGEVDGSRHMDAVIDYVLEVYESRHRFAGDYVFHFIPHANPDGIYHAHHRSDTQGNDLNRRWASNSPVEVRNMQEYMLENVTDPYWGFDYHTATGVSYYSIFYQSAAASETDVERLEEMAAASLSYTDEISSGHSSSQAMGWFREQFDAVMAVTESYQYREYTLEELRREGEANLEILTTVHDPLAARVATVVEDGVRTVLTDDDGRIVIVGGERTE